MKENNSEFTRMRDPQGYRNHDDRILALVSLLTQLDSKSVAQFAVNYVTEYLNQPENRSYELSWPKLYLNRIKSVVDAECVSDSCLNDMNPPVEDYLSSALKNSIMALRAMAIVKDKIGDVAKYAAEAIDWSISTEIYSLIARVSPDVVKIHNDNSLSRTQRMNLQVGLVIKATSLPEVRNLKMELWSRLADKLELLDGMSS